LRAKLGGENLLRRILKLIEAEADAGGIAIGEGTFFGGETWLI